MASQDDETGTWVLEGQCGDCGHIEIAATGRPTRHPDNVELAQKTARLHMCRGYFKGRPRNRCGWPITWVWVWTPKEKADDLGISLP